MAQSQLVLPLIVYLSNFVFAAGLSLGDGFIVPVSFGFILGVIPAVVLWLKSSSAPASYAEDGVENAANEVAVASLKVAVK